jgi:NIMA-interacting peptidyl-prolyl cis-trans isomerase 1
LDEARSIVQGHRDHLASLPADQLREQFAKIAAEMSDCSSAKKGGDLGFFGPGQMQKAFEVSSNLARALALVSHRHGVVLMEQDGTYALEVGQMSELIETDSGVHIILRTA